MKDLVKKVAIGLSTGALIAQSLVLPAFASITVVVSGNGSSSDNDVKVGQTNNTTVTQSNTANISNDINANANTGGNHANDNTGSDVSIDTGNAKSTVKVDNTVNSNEAQVKCGGCPTDVKVEVSGNGTHSDNDVNLDLKNKTWVDQKNDAVIHNDIDSKANSGKNNANDNTGGDVSVHTGKAEAWALVNNKANANVAHVGSSGRGALELKILGNGSDSDNDIAANLSNEVTVRQDNYADIANDVDVKANSGKNNANDNTGGSSSIHTGDAKAGAAVDNMANFNLADVQDCCQFDGLVKVAGNGTGSDSNVDLTLASTLFADQKNDFACGDHKELGLFDWSWKRSEDCNKVDAKATTGKNDLNDNTGTPNGDPGIHTGNGTTEVDVKNTGNANVFTTGDALPDFPDLSGQLSLGQHDSLLFWFLAHLH